ncbi:IclR family transcriptional regulator [Pseudonocardia sp. H11422]|uniref:IclR family transcriptional regulator n=1 Tax=Pseudonocardia sp. H11422 TaxID=2835866 RepID=UPI001BDC4103|nr:helix-turn-helix domain-containing protein [Pseudonocardia sp. H11422]
MSSSGPTLIQSVQRALRLLEIVAGHDGRANAKELSRAAGLSLPTTYHLLRTLAHEGYLQRLDDGSYVLGHRLDVVLRHGSASRAIAQARPALEWLRDELASAVYLALYADGEVVIVEIVDSPKTPRIDLWVGIHDAAHATALGKCILGQLPAQAREEYLADHPLHDLTPHTVVDRRRLRDRLPQPGAVAVDDQEYAVGIHCLASAVATPGAVGAVGFVTPGRGRTAAGPLRQTLTAGAARVSRALALH